MLAAFESIRTLSKRGNLLDRFARFQSGVAKLVIKTFDLVIKAYDRDVRFGSTADMCSAKAHVRFTPNSDRESRHPQEFMSALPPKADMCGATSDVRFGPIADIMLIAATPPQSGSIGEAGATREN